MKERTHKHEDKHIVTDHDYQYSVEGLTFCEKKEVNRIYFDSLCSRDSHSDHSITHRKRNVDAFLNKMNVR